MVLGAEAPGTRTGDGASDGRSLAARHPRPTGSTRHTITGPTCTTTSPTRTHTRPTCTPTGPTCTPHHTAPACCYTCPLPTSPTCIPPEPAAAALPSPFSLLSAPTEGTGPDVPVVPVVPPGTTISPPTAPTRALSYAPLPRSSPFPVAASPPFLSPTTFGGTHTPLRPSSQCSTGNPIRHMPVPFPPRSRPL